MFRAMLTRPFTRKVASTIRNPRPAFRPCLHELEDRTVPAFAVNLDYEAYYAGGSTDVPEDGLDLQQIFIWDTDGNSAPITVNFSITGTATEGDDYTVAGFNGGPGTYSVVLGGVYFDIGAHDDFGNGPTAITLVDDSVSEPDETIILTILPGTGYTVGADSTYTFTVKDDEPNVVTVAAGADATEGGASGSFVFTRTGDLSQTLTTNYTVQTVGPGLATPGTDYTALSGTVTFAAGSATAIVGVAAINDGVYDPGETVHVTVDTGTGYTVGTEDAAGITIADAAAGVIDLTGGSGTYWYEVPLGDVDPDEATQSIPLTDFTLVFGGQTFDASSPYFTQVPTAALEYGTLVNITFAITFAAPVAGYTSLAVDGGEATAVDAVTSIEEMAGVTDTDPALLVLDFAPVNITAYTETYVINVVLEDNTVVPVGSVSLPGSGNPNGTKTGWRNLVFDAMSSKTSLAVKKDADSDTRLRIQAVSGTQLKSVVIYNTTTPAPTGPKIHFREQGGAEAVPTLVYQSSPG